MAGLTDVTTHPSTRATLLLAVLWMVVSFLATSVVIVGLLVVLGTTVPRLAIDQAGGFAGEALLLGVALRMGRGLGGGPIRRPWLVAAIAATPPLAVGGLVAVVAALPGAVERMRPMMTPNTSQTLQAAPLLVASGMLLTVALAPLAEELFFRGWLWARLRPHWRPLATGACTGILFMLLHLTGGWLKPLAVLPTTILLTLARHYGGTVKASLIVHVANNATIAAITLLARQA